MLQNVIQSHEPKDPPRNEERVKLLVKLRNKFAIVGGAFVQASEANQDGYVEIVRYKSDVAQIMKDVETDWAVVDAAKESYARKLREYVVGKLGIQDEQLPASIADWSEEQKQCERTFDGSVEAEFHSMKGRGIKRLLDAKVVETGIAPPQSLEEQLFSRVLGGVQANGQGQDVAATVSAVIEALVEKGLLTTRKSRD